MRTRLTSFAVGRTLPVLAVLLVAIRFAGPSVSASLGVQGFDTATLNDSLAFYGGLMPAIAAALVAAVVLAWPRGFGADRWLLLVLALVAWDLAFWVGEVDSGYRLVWGPWATLPLGLGVTVTILAYGITLEVRLRRAGFGSMSRAGFRALYGGFALAYGLGFLRFIDYRYALGVTPPSGWLWLINYGPTFVPCALSMSFWVMLAVRPRFTMAGTMRSLALPLLGALAGIVVSQGLGGFILSNALAWGGAYEVFVPTAFSLGIVGSAVGSFLATAWTLRGRLPDAAWRLVVGGVTTTVLAGVVSFGGTIASLAGILLGLTCASRGLSIYGGLSGIDSDARFVHYSRRGI